VCYFEAHGQRLVSEPSTLCQTPLLCVDLSRLGPPYSSGAWLRPLVLSSVTSHYGSKVSVPKSKT
jgi:hypothetical protein